MKKLYRRSISGLMALLICFTTILGGGITAFAASSGEVAKSYSIGFPRSGDANLDYSGTWGHDELHYMNGWTSGEATWMTTLHTIGSFDGPACYCIEPGVPRLLEKTYTRYGEDYWKNYPSDYNSTIDADTIKTLLGRIMQYGYQGDLSLDWRSQNESDADKMAHMMATQVLVWETVVGERDANFNHVDPGSADAVKSVYRTSHPLYSRFSAYYDSIEASVQSHTVIPSFMSKTPNKAQTVELKWDGSQYTATLTDSNHVVSDYTFSSNLSDIVFTSNGDTLTITAKTAPAEPVTISASKNNIRKGVVVWSDGHYGPDGTMQDAVTYAATVMDPVQAFLNLKVSYGSAKIIKTSEDGKVDNLTFTVTGNGVNQTVKTNAKGEIQIDNLMPGVYTVTEMDYDKYEPQESRRVTVVSGQVSTVTFNNKLKRGDLQIVKSSEDNLNEGVTFHLYGTSLSGIAVDEYAVTDANGVATFEDVLISGSTPYTVEEVDTAIRYVVPEAQSAPINWYEVTNRSFLNILKKFSVTVTKSDAETGTAQGDASLAGAVYGIYKGETLVDTYTTDKNGQFVTKEYICDNDWTVREITPSEGYLLDTTVHKVGAEPQLYTVEHNQTANDVTEQVVKGNSGIKLLKGFNDLKTKYPSLATEWSEKNLPLTPDAVNEKSTKNVWWKCNTCGYEWKAVVKARVKGGMCPVCAERAVLQGYNDLGTTDPHLLSEWDYEKNSKWTPSNVSRNSMKVVWWKCGAGHSYRAKITDRTIEQKGCPQCEAEFQQALPQMLIMMYGAQNGITVKSNSDSELGMRLVAYLPELHCAVDIAGATVTEKREQSVKAHICQSNRLSYYLIKRTADTSQMAAEIKTLFIRNHIYLHTDSEKDVQVLRERFLEWKNRNACKLNGKY